MPSCMQSPGLQKGGNGGNMFPANLKFWQPFWLMIHVLLSRNKLCLISRMPGKNGCKTKMAFILKYLTARCICQLKVAARKKKKDCRPKSAASQNWPPEWMPANKRQDRNGWYPKLGVKIACQKKCIPANIGCQPKSTTSQMPVQAKSCCQPKNGCQPNVAASQKQLTAKCQCKLKVAAIQGMTIFKHTKLLFFCDFGVFEFCTLAATLGF